MGGRGPRWRMRLTNVRSPYESYARAILIQNRIGPIRVNAPVGKFEVDMLIGDRVVSEIDGDVKYDGATYGRTDDVLRKERVREKRLLNDGYLVRRHSPSDVLNNEAQYVGDIRAACALAAIGAPVTPQA